MYFIMEFKDASKEQDLILEQVLLSLDLGSSQALWLDVKIYIIYLARYAAYQSRKSVLLFGSLTTAVIGISFITDTVKTTPLLASIILYFIFVCDCYKFSALCLIES